MKMRIMAMLLSAVMCVGMLSGCGGGDASKGNGASGNELSDDENGGATAGNQGGSQTAADEGEPYEIVIELMSFGTAPADMDEVTEAINAITLPEINATVKFLTVAIPDHATKLSLLATGGEKLDLVAAGVTVSPVNLVEDGVLTDLTDLLDTYAPELTAMEGDLLKSGTFNGKVYTVPGTLYPGRKMMFAYNKKMAEDCGIRIPDSLDRWEDWDALLAECKEKLPEGVYPLSLGDGGAGNSWNLGYFDAMGDTNYLTYGVMRDIENGTELVNWYETEEYKEILTKKHEWYEAGYIVPDSMTSGFTTNDSIVAGTCFAKVDGTSASKNEANPGNGLSVELSCILLSDAMVTNSDIYTYNWGIPVTSEQPEKVLQFLNLMFTNPDLMNLLNFGIEGRHYVKTEEGSRVITYPEGVDASNVGWTGTPNWWGDHAQALVRTPNTEAYYDLIHTYGVEQARLSNALGYTFNTEPVKTELAAIQIVIDTYRPSLECGLVDVETELPKFIQELDAAGIHKVIAENQKQYTEWLSTK